MRHLSSFGRFWWEFLVGDTPEVTLGIAVVIGVAAGLAHVGEAAVIAVPLGVLAVLSLSVMRGRAGRRQSGASPVPRPKSPS